MRSFVKKPKIFATLSAGYAALLAAPALASSTSTSLPWETPLQTIQNSLTGPVATSISVIALFAAGAALVFGDEMSAFVKRILVGVMAFTVLVLGANFLGALHLTGLTI